MITRRWRGWRRAGANPNSRSVGDSQLFEKSRLLPPAGVIESTAFRKESFANAVNMSRRKNMGRVLAKVRLTNLGDLFVRERKFSKAEPRSVEVETLVDTGAT